MNKIGLVLSALFLLAFGVSAQAAKDTHAAPADTKTVAAKVSKPVPPELAQGLAKLGALSQAIADLKHEHGIDELEADLNKKGQELLALAAKEGFHYDQALQNFVTNEEPAAKDVKPADPKKP